MPLSIKQCAPASGLRIAQAGFALVVCLLTVGCVSVAPVEPAPPVPTTPALEQFVQDAQTAKAAGQTSRMRLIYREAAAAYPAEKLPWLALAQDYFAAQDYGQAILAAQEVVHRDASDNVAVSILAVGGLRIASDALGDLRHNNMLDNESDAKSSARAMASMLREVLDEPVLVPQEPEPVSKPRRKRRVSTATVQAAAPEPAPVAERPAQAAPAKPANPFEKFR